MIRTRFAPSPTGFLHVGGLRTALFAYVYAKRHDGKFVLRIEDTDRERFVEGGIENIIRSLAWAGIDIDEGSSLDQQGHVIEKGEYGPYIQSQRQEIYVEHVQLLLEKEAAYYCFCTKDRLDELRKMQELNKQPTGYDGLCRTLTADEVKEKMNAGEKAVVRLKVEKDTTVKINDLVCGNVEFDSNVVDDQVLLKSDGFPTYHLAVVVDDHHMNITHVIRGADWLPSTPKHVLLYEAFGWERPVYAHLPLLVNEQKQKLSKRHGDVSVEDFKEKGYLPEALVNFIMFLGWNPGDERELFTLAEFEKEFAIEKVAKAAAVFNREKLDWYNKQYIAKLSVEELVELARPFLLNAGIAESLLTDTDQLKKIVALEQTRSATLLELASNLGYMFADQLVYERELLVWKKSTLEDAKEKLEEVRQVLEQQDDSLWDDAKKIEEVLVGWLKEKEYGVGDVLWPLRISLSGQKNSPGPFELSYALGKEKTLARITHAIAQLS